MSLIAVNWNPSVKHLRQFGAIGLVVFALLGAKFYSRQAHTIGLVFWTLAIACGIAAALAPSKLRPLYVVMSAIGFPIGIALSSIVLAIVFYGLITPIGLFMRLIGRDTLQRQLNPQLSTYWQEHPPIQDIRRYFRQS